MDIFDGFKAAQTNDTEEKIQTQKETLESFTTLLMGYEKLFDLDAEHINKSYYRQPWDSKDGHRQLNPAYALV